LPEKWKKINTDVGICMLGERNEKRETKRERERERDRER